jgi:hypothetical protein
VTELSYLKSAAPPVSFIQTPLQEAIDFLSAKHRMPIAVDWKSLEKEGITPKTIVNQNLVDGSLPWAMQRLFIGHDRVRVVPTEYGAIVITADETSTDFPNPMPTNRFEPPK